MTDSTSTNTVITESLPTPISMATTSAGNSAVRAVPATKAAGDVITADTLAQMAGVLQDLLSHNHTFYDDYTTVCDCQCQCDCSRGTL
jgi:hypothetical protein